MELQSAVENEKFMMIFGSPFKSCGILMTLKSGVILMCISDLIIGVINFIFFIIAMIEFFNWGYYYSFFYFTLLLALINVANIPFAFIGLRGITKLNIQDLELYYKFEIVELVLEFVFKTIETVIISRYDDHGLIPQLIKVFFIAFLSGIMTKVVWSALVRLRYNETVLVMHGEGALVLMQQQAVNLANPKVISPGMPIYFSQPV